MSRSPLVTLALLLALAPGAALAEPSTADRDRARQLANEGYDALDQKDYPTAAERFTRADALFHVSTVALGLARAQAGLGRLVEAQQTYGRIVAEGAAPGAPAPLVNAVAEARRELARLAPRVPSVVITVNGPEPAVVTLDGAAVDRAALGSKRPIDPGKHVVRATAPRRKASEATVTVGEGTSQTVTLELRAVEAEPSPPAERPEVSAPPNEPPAGGEGAPAVRWPAQKTAGVALMGAGALGAGLGGVFIALAHTKYSDLNKACPSHTACDPGLASELQSYHALSTASRVSLVVGGVALGSGLVVYLAAPKPDAPRGQGAFVSPRLSCSPGLCRVGLTGGF
jgi:hypothetical protein